MVIVGLPKWCKDCGDYVPNIADHIKQHNLGRNIDAVEHKQYTGITANKEENYMICVLHQRKAPCKARKFDGSKCDYPFGMIKKSFMMDCIKGYSINPAEKHLGKIHPPYFPVSSDENSSWYGVLINMEDRTVVIKGATIHLKF